MSLRTGLLLDTNVWVENYVGERGSLTRSRDLIDRCLEREVDLFVSIASLKDVYYRIGAYLKGRQREKAGLVDEPFARAAEQMAWHSALNLMEIATVVPMDVTDLPIARQFHALHADLEDDLVLAAAVRAQVDYLVTSDKKLLSKAVVPTLSPADMLTLLEAGE